MYRVSQNVLNKFTGSVLNDPDTFQMFRIHSKLFGSVPNVPDPFKVIRIRFKGSGSVSNVPDPFQMSRIRSKNLDPFLMSRIHCKLSGSKSRVKSPTLYVLQYKYKAAHFRAQLSKILLPSDYCKTLWREKYMELQKFTPLNLVNFCTPINIFTVTKTPSFPPFLLSSDFLLPSSLPCTPFDLSDCATPPQPRKSPKPR